MGKLTYSMITSLDGYVADNSGEFASWARPDEEVLAAVNARTRVGTYLYGRRMYETMAVWDSDSFVTRVTAESPSSAEFARLWQAADKVVYSTTLEQVSTQRTELRREFDPARVADLKASAGADLTIDGPTLAAQALRHGLVDEISMLICPIVLGGGLAFLPGQRLNLRLTGEQRFGNGVVHLTYAVVR